MREIYLMNFFSECLNIIFICFILQINCIVEYYDHIRLINSIQYNMVKAFRIYPPKQSNCT